MFNIRENTEKESKTLKEIEKNYKICRRSYNSVYKSIAGHYQQNFKTLDYEEIEELNNDIKANGWALKSIQEYDSVFNLL